MLAWAMPKHVKLYRELKIFVNKELFLLSPSWSAYNLRSSNNTLLPKFTVMTFLAYHEQEFKQTKTGR